MTFELLRGRLHHDASLVEYNSWRVGGAADILYLPADLQDVTYFLSRLSLDIPVLWLGLGSNVLIRDGGVTGAVIITQGGLTQIALVGEAIVRIEAGVSCAQAARYTARLGFTGLEFLAGIPGTVGGALAMNAGCYGGETWEHVVQVETINRLGVVEIKPKRDFEIGYRHVKGRVDEWFVAGYFQLMRGEKTQSLTDIRTLLEKRNASQPTGLPNCGSVFRNPDNHFAARLIEQCGLKGKRIGGAIVSDKHANFIINEGTATAKDIEELIMQISEIVYQQCHVKLMPEVCIIGKIK